MITGRTRPDAVPGDSVEALSREAYALLAQANLLRMRGEWPDAIAKCMAALRLSPDNPSAQSLLGDIYDNQGRLDDAVQWYRMALDVQPDSPADQIKLARLLELKARDLAAPLVIKPNEAAPVNPQPGTPMSRRSRWPFNPDTVLRRFAYVAGTLVVLVVLTALILTHHSFSLGGSQKQVDAPTVVVPSVASDSTPMPSPAAASPVVADPSEATLLDALRASVTTPNQECAVAATQIDPRDGRLTVTVTYTPSAGAAPSRDQTLRAVSGVLQAAVQQTDARVISQFTVRCLLSSATGGSTPLIFTADAARPAIATLNPNLTLLTKDQITAAYTDPWWAPTLTQ